MGEGAKGVGGDKKGGKGGVKKGGEGGKTGDFKTDKCLPSAELKGSVSRKMCGVNRKGTNSGTGRNCVAVPKACPKSMPMHWPFFVETRQLLWWRSPIPRIQ